MVELNELKAISAQKRLLLAQSELCRRSLELQIATVRAETLWLRRGWELFARYRAVLWLAAPVGGFLVARRRRKLQQVLFRGLTAWQVLRRLAQWRRLIQKAR